MVWYQYLFLVVLFLPAVILVFIDKCKEAKKKKEMKPYFVESKLDEYENQLLTYLNRYNLETGCTIKELLNKTGFSISYCKKEELFDGETIKEGKVIQELKLIKLDDSLSKNLQPFVVGHEFGHLVRGAETIVYKDKHPMKPAMNVEEQEKRIEEGICDYIAAAILLPYDYMLKAMRTEEYKHMGPIRKRRFVKKIASEREATELTVFRRIKEVKRLAKYRELN